MKEKDFKKNIVERLSQVASEHNCELLAQNVNKVNMQAIEAVTFRGENIVAAPTLYLDDMYKAFLSGVSIDEQVSRIERLLTNESSEHFNLSISADMIKSNSFPQLISLSENVEFLKDTPHIVVGEDMALITRVDVGNDGSFVVKDSIIERYQLTKNELIESAISNLEESPYELQPLYGMIENIIGIPMEKELDPQIMVLTSTRSAYGAAELMNRKAMAEATALMSANEHGFFILPSSLHEALLVPIPNGEDANVVKQSLKEMVKSVNDTTVDKVDRLSYSVYYYDPRRQSILNADSCDLSFKDNDRPHMSHHM